MPEMLLHGALDATIYEVDNNINADGRGGSLFGKFTSAIWKDGKHYATIDLDKCEVSRTRILENEPENPNWNERFHIYCAHRVSNVIITVKEVSKFSDPVIGSASIPVANLLEGREADHMVAILDTNKNGVKSSSEIRVKLRYLDVTEDPYWGRGIGSSMYSGVPYTCFPQRQGCRVVLYQDAHVPDDFIPKMDLSNGSDYEPHRCWEDMFDAITNAKYFIYIAGWSVHTEVSLVRKTEGGKETLGELLIKKAREGVKVLMLLWKDFSGAMATHATETEQYFKGSAVKCFLCLRNPHDGLFTIENIFYTHHQKLLVVDSELSNGDSKSRHVVSFVGGLDFCNGRYDTPIHSLFRTLNTAHKNDFHQPNFGDGSIKKGGPREPWHDIHLQLQGQIARDVLLNFEQRWNKQAQGEFPFDFRAFDEVVTHAVFPNDEESWNVQLFRSIDSNSTSGLPEEAAQQSGLVRGKHSIIDRSIQDAYIHAIRRAKNFIYIENQYFIGSSFGWKFEDTKDDKVDVLHLIPKELSLKIVSKIKAGEKFTVYIVVPMWPEKDPKSAIVQEILYWQRKTMEMMYKDIIQALKEKGLQDDPRDYLTFFCLGNREVKRMGEYEPSEAPNARSNYQNAQVARRFMIYVHAKMMIVDDEYIIVGSANINQRSMDGGRDSEIAMGAYQPLHITATPASERGQVYGFRRALWYEHLGKIDHKSFQHPGSRECVQEVNRIADRNWRLFSSDNLESDLPGHLLRYPIDVSSKGIVTQLHGTQFFPDTDARILGTKIKYSPEIIHKTM